MLELFLALNRLVWWFLQLLEAHPKEILHSPMTKSMMFCQHFFKNDKKNTYWSTFSFTYFDTIWNIYLSPMSKIRTSLRLRMPMIYFAVMIKWRKNNLFGFTEKMTDLLFKSSVWKRKINRCFLLPRQIWFDIFY